MLHYDLRNSRTAGILVTSFRRLDLTEQRTGQPRVVILTGVAGSGKTTIGKALAQRLGCPFYDADDFHPPQNIAKMSRGEPLDDADRAPWLQRLHTLLKTLREKNQPAVLACSALKADYRRRLSQGLDNICFVYLHGDFDLIFARLQGRRNHYMSAAMLQSQFNALEPPAPREALLVDVDAPLESIVNHIIDALPHSCHAPSPD